MTQTLKIACALILLSHACLALAQQRSVEACGSLENHYGPFDYINPEHRTAEKGHRLRIVEQHHFTHQVESLQRGESTVYVGGDISYTLRVWPNHHRALLAATRLALKHKSERPDHMSLSIDCWFDRAKRMSPEDGMVPAIFATYLAKRNRKQEAMENAADAFALSPDNKNVNYNIAVAYLELKEYAKAKEHAVRAEELGHPLSGVKKRLMALGKW